MTSILLFFPEIAEANPPSNLSAVRVGPTSIRVSWTAPASGATVMGYRIYYSEGTNQGSEDAGASATDLTITIPQPQSSLTYSITIVALSTHLPSTVVGPAMVTVGKQRTPFVYYSLFYTYVLSMLFSSNRPTTHCPYTHTWSNHSHICCGLLESTAICR